MKEILLSVRNVSKHYTVKKGLFSSKTVIKAVDDVSFDIYKGETVGLIGESGCGKTTTGELLTRLIDCDQGSIFFHNIELTRIEDKVMRRLRKDLQIVFQQGQETLDPKATIEELIGAPIRLHQIVTKDKYDEEINRLLMLVGLSEGDRYKYPYQLSGGQRQRVGIARAVASRPKLIVCDEPVSALDVSIQGQILNLLLDLKRELDLTYLFISHDLKVIQHICQRIAVMYEGKIVEIGERDEILNDPKHDYTKKLLNATL